MFDLIEPPGFSYGEHQYFYHMEILANEEEIEEFYPRVPMDLMEGENEDIDRICVSTSIRGCISSAPWGQDRALTFGNNMVFRVYKFDSKDIDNENIIYSKELYERDLVHDALITDECWIVNQNIKPCEVFYIKIDDYKKSMEPLKAYRNFSEYSDVEFSLEDYINSKENMNYDSLDYTKIDKEELLFGGNFKFSMDYLSSLGDYEDVESELIDIITESYMIGDDIDSLISYDDGEYLEVEMESFYTGLWHKQLINDLEERLL